MADKATLIVHSGDMDKLYSALIIGNGALSMGMEASLYFTFWGLERLKKGGLEKGPLSRMNLLGLGKWMVKLLFAKPCGSPLRVPGKSHLSHLLLSQPLLITSIQVSIYSFNKNF